MVMTRNRIGFGLSRAIPAAFAALMLLLTGVNVADAQYYGQRSVCVTSRGNCDGGYAALGDGCYCNIPGFGRKAGNIGGAQYAHPQRRQYYQPHYQPRYEDDDGYYNPYPRRRQAYGSMCVTSRGECPVGRPVPIMSGCYCYIPGFGRKAGNVRY